MRTCGYVYSLLECGCIGLLMYDIPEVVHDARDDIHQYAMKGRTIQRCARGELPPSYCAEHARSA
jgi:hypothetical protein